MSWKTATIFGVCMAVTSTFSGLSLAQNAPAQELTEPQEMVSDVNFTKGTTSWNFEQHDAAKGTIAIENDAMLKKPAMCVTVTNPGKEAWHIQLTQGTQVQQARRYKLSITARAEKDATIQMSVTQGYTPWKSYSQTYDLPLTTTWKTFTYIFTSDSDDTKARIDITGLGKAAISYWLTGISLKALPHNATGGNLLANADFSSNMANWSATGYTPAKLTSSIVKDGPNGKNALLVDVTQPGTQTWQVQITQLMYILSADKSYDISFWAKAEKPCSMFAAIQQNYTPFQNIGASRCDLTTDWKQYKLTVPVKADDKNVRFMFTELGKYVGRVWFADVSVVATGVDKK